MILNRAAPPRPSQRTPGPFRLIANNFAAMTARLARLEADLNELREQIELEGFGFIVPDNAAWSMRRSCRVSGLVSLHDDERVSFRVI